MKKLLLTLFVSCSINALIAQTSDSINIKTIADDNNFSISAQVRARGEYRNGALTPLNEGGKPAGFVNNRTRISMGYKRSNLQMQFSAQHVGVWGQDPQTDKTGRVSVNEAWGKMNFFDKKAFAQVGRMILSYDDERILGALDWHVAGRFHDALKLGYEYNQHKLHLIGAFNQNDERTEGNYYAAGGQPYKNMQTLWYQYQATDAPFKASFLAMNLGFESGTPDTSDSRYMQTLGTNLSYKLDRWNFAASAYYQIGKNKNQDNISAALASAEVSFKINDAWALSGAFDYLSGNSSTTSKYGAFDPLYGTHHKFYGFMDMFYVPNSFKKGFNPGLTDSRFGLMYKVGERVNMSLHYHYFTTAAKIDDFTKSLGSEIDYQINVKIMKDVSLVGGYSFFVGATETMELVKGGDRNRWQDWAWLSININPQIFKTKW
ncbi:MAG: alginate export family protein [Bacteroidales bacterium]